MSDDYVIVSASSLKSGGWLKKVVVAAVAVSALTSAFLAGQARAYTRLIGRVEAIEENSRKLISRLEMTTSQFEIAWREQHQTAELIIVVGQYMKAKNAMIEYNKRTPGKYLSDAQVGE